MEAILEERFEAFGLTRHDIDELRRDNSVTAHMLQLLPIYKQCMQNYSVLSKVLKDKCHPHMRSAAETECYKSLRILEVLDVIILKLLVGEFSVPEQDSLNRLLEKFSADQNTLCEVQRIRQLVSMDGLDTQRLMSSVAGMDEREVDQITDQLIRDISRLPPIPEEPPQDESEGTETERAPPASPDGEKTTRTKREAGGATSTTDTGGDRKERILLGA